MPSGARTKEQGRPARWPIIQGPTASWYRARSSFVTGRPAPSSGHSALSGLEMGMPMTTAPLFAAALDELRAEPLPFVGAALVVSSDADFGAFFFAPSVGFTAVSRVTSVAGLSSRRPLKAA